MKKYLFSIIFALSALVMLNGCIVSDKKLSEKIQSAIVDEEASNGKTLEVTEFSLGDKIGKNYIPTGSDSIFAITNYKEFEKNTCEINTACGFS